MVCEVAGCKCDGYISNTLIEAQNLEYEIYEICENETTHDALIRAAKMLKKLSELIVDYEQIRKEGVT